MEKKRVNLDSDFSDSEESPLDIHFNKAVDHLVKIADNLTTDKLLQLYGLYKQGTVGKCDIPKPGIFDTKGRKKWEAWTAVSKLSKLQAKQRYIKLMKVCDPTWNHEPPRAGTAASKIALVAARPDESTTSKESWATVTSVQRSPLSEQDDSKYSLINVTAAGTPGAPALNAAGPAERKPSKESWAAVSSLQRSPSPEQDDSKYPLINAVKNFDAALITELLKSNPHLAKERDEEGMTALHWAADRNAVDALHACLDGGCNVHAMDDTGQTALHYAASCGHKESTRVLVNAGALLLKDKFGTTPIDIASDAEIKEILSALLNCECK